MVTFLAFKLEGFQMKLLSAKFGFTPAPKMAQNERKLYKIGASSSKFTLFGGGPQFLWTNDFVHIWASPRIG